MEVVMKDVRCAWDGEGDGEGGGSVVIKVSFKLSS